MTKATDNPALLTILRADPAYLKLEALVRSQKAPAQAMGSV